MLIMLLWATDKAIGDIRQLCSSREELSKRLQFVLATMAYHDGKQLGFAEFPPQ